MGNLKAIALKYSVRALIAFAAVLSAYSVFAIYRDTRKNDATIRIEDDSPIVERYLGLNNIPKTAAPDYDVQLVKKFNDMPLPFPITTMRFTRSGEDFIARNSALAPFGTSPGDVFVPGDTEIIFKGGTHEMAIITVKKSTAEMDIEQSFSVLPGEIIGGSGLLTGKRGVTFMTGCTLQEITVDAEKVLSSNKILVNVDDSGQLTDTTVSPDPITISTMKIIYKNKRFAADDAQELLLGESANIGTVTALIGREQ